MISKFIQKFDFKLDPTHQFKMVEEFTLKPFGGVKCSLTLRN